LKRVFDTDPDLTCCPKAELHCHLGGAIDAAMLRSAFEHGYRPRITPAELEAALPVQGYRDFVRWMTIVAPARTDLELMKFFMQRHIERLKAQHVTYAEVMLGTRGFEGRTNELVRRAGELRAVVERASIGIQVEVINSLYTSEPPDYAEEISGPLIEVFERGLIAGVDWAGADQYPLQPFRRTLDRFRDAGVPTTIHAGEWAGPEVVREALDYGHATRIGHGVAIFRNPDLIRRFQDEQIHIELCPTSNLKTGAIERIEDHPLRQALELGLNFSINTDDPGTFECTLESEYRLAVEQFGFAFEDLERVTASALRSRFRK
jgi:adenosine deaminase